MDPLEASTQTPVEAFETTETTSSELVTQAQQTQQTTAASPETKKRKKATKKRVPAEHTVLPEPVAAPPSVLEKLEEPSQSSQRSQSSLRSRSPSPPPPPPENGENGKKKNKRTVKKYPASDASDANDQQLRDRLHRAFFGCVFSGLFFLFALLALNCIVTKPPHVAQHVLISGKTCARYYLVLHHLTTYAALVALAAFSFITLITAKKIFESR